MITAERILNYTVQHSSCPHKREFEKPNEDFIFTDKDNGIFVLLDGITRVHCEYEKNPYESAASTINKLFFDKLYSFLIENITASDKKKLLLDAITIANKEILPYREQKTLAEWEFYPATLGIIAVLDGNTLHYACAGDCIGVIIRNNSKIVFGRQLSLEALSKMNISKKERYSQYCNHPENDLSYGVFNGDDVMSQIVEYSYIDVHSKDVLILASDGLADFVKYEKSDKLTLLSTEEMLVESEKYDIPPYASYADDKAIIKIEFNL